MTSRDRYLEAGQQIRLIRYALANQNLTAERRTELQNHDRPLLPLSWSKRLLMVLIFAIGLQQVLVGHYAGALWWLLLPLFSPRLNAEFGKGKPG